jgi:phosphomannomutase
MDNPHKQTVVVNDATSDLVREITQMHGAKIKEVEVGEINVVDEMKKLKSLVGGEGSSGGSIIAPQTCRDGMLSTLIIAQHIARSKKTIDEIIDKFPKYYIQIKKIKKSPSDDLRNKIEKQFTKNDNIGSIQKTGDSMGGLKIRFLDNAWLWFRASRTEPGLMRIYAESKNENRAKELIKQGEKILNKI